MFRWRLARHPTCDGCRGLLPRPRSTFGLFEDLLGSSLDRFCWALHAYCQVDEPLPPAHPDAESRRSRPACSLDGRTSRSSTSGTTGAEPSCRVGTKRRLVDTETTGRTAFSTSAYNPVEAGALRATGRVAVEQLRAPAQPVPCGRVGSWPGHVLSGAVTRRCSRRRSRRPPRSAPPSTSRANAGIAPWPFVTRSITSSFGGLTRRGSGRRCRSRSRPRARGSRRTRPRRRSPRRPEPRRRLPRSWCRRRSSCRHPPPTPPPRTGSPATDATYAATASASSPVTRSAGIPGEPVLGSSTGYEIWSRTTARIVASPSPSWRACRNASSRFGPITPFEPASASTWHEPHCPSFRNSSLPRAASPPEVSPPEPQPVAARAAISTAQAPTSPRRLT